MLLDERKRLERTREKALQAYYATEDSRERRLLQETIEKIDRKLDASKSDRRIINCSSTTDRYDEDLRQKMAYAGGSGSKNYPY